MGGIAPGKLGVAWWWEHGAMLRREAWRYVKVVGACRQVKAGGMALCQGGESMALG